MNAGASLGADCAVADIAGGYGGFAAPPPISLPRLSLLPMDRCREVWQTLVNRDPQSSIYHDLEWQRVLHSAYGLNFQAAVLEQDDYGPIAGCVFARARNPFSRRLIALPFSDYCAPLEVETGGCAALLEALAARLSVAGEACELRGATAPSPWVVDDRFRHWKLDLGVGVKAVEQAMDRNFRRQIRRAREAGLTVSYGASTDYARRFYRLHLENRRRLGLPAPPWRFFRLVAEILGAAGRFEVWLADADGRELGGVVLLKDRATLHCKWSARATTAPAGTMQLLFADICAHYAGSFATLDLGRTDINNDGLSRFKREMGAAPAPLPYAFFPRAPRHISSEQVNGPARALTALWRRLPLAATRIIGSAIYGYLA